MQDAVMGYMGKWTSDNRDVIATAQLQGQGVFNATYWQKLNEKVDVAADLQVVLAGGQRQAVSSVGAKYDFRMST